MLLPSLQEGEEERQGFLSLSTADTWGRITFCCGCGSVHCWTFISNPRCPQGRLQLRQRRCLQTLPDVPWGGGQNHSHPATERLRSSERVPAKPSQKRAVQKIVEADPICLMLGIQGLINPFSQANIRRTGLHGGFVKKTLFCEFIFASSTQVVSHLCGGLFFFSSPPLIPPLILRAISLNKALARLSPSWPPLLGGFKLVQ